MKISREMLKHIIFIIVFCVIIGIEFAYRDPLYNASFDIIENIQKNRSTAFGDWFFYYLALIGAGPLYFGILLIIMNWGSRSRTFYIMMLLCSCLFIMNITKLLYHQPRPYVLDPNITPKLCSTEFGNPSGHTLFVGAFFACIFLDTYHANYEREEHSMISYLLGLAGTLTIMAIMAYDRVYNGVHAINQVIFGL